MSSLGRKVTFAWKWGVEGLLRFGHARVLTTHRGVIHCARVALLRRPLQMKNIIDFVGAFIERPRANTRQATKFAFANLSSPLRHILSLIRRAVPWCRRPQMAGFFWPSPTMEGLSRLPPGGSSRRSRVRESAWIWRNISLCPRGLLPSFASQNPPRCFAFAKLDRRLRPVLSEGGLWVSVKILSRISKCCYILSRFDFP